MKRKLENQEIKEVSGGLSREKRPSDRSGFLIEKRTREVTVKPYCKTKSRYKKEEQ